jgi:hypothetical protein
MKNVNIGSSKTKNYPKNNYYKHNSKKQCNMREIYKWNTLNNKIKLNNSNILYNNSKIKKSFLNNKSKLSTHNFRISLIIYKSSLYKNKKIMINNFKSTPNYNKTLNLRTIKYICTNNNYQISSSNSKKLKIKF